MSKALRQPARLVLDLVLLLVLVMEGIASSMP
jgi:hypothetical protein